MALKDLLKRREKTKESPKEDLTPTRPPPPAEFTFLRTTTTTQELITPPSFASDELSKQSTPKTKHRSNFRNTSVSSTSSRKSNKSERRLPRLHLRSHSQASSANVPSDLPIIKDGGNKAGKEEQAKWEERATILAQKNANTRSRSTSEVGNSSHAARGLAEDGLDKKTKDRDHPIVPRNISDAQGDVGT